MSVSTDRMYLQNEDGSLICLRAVDGIIQASTNGTDWADIAAAGGGGTVASIVAGTGITVDDTDPENPIVTAIPSFGADTSVLLPNASAADVTALQLVASLTVATAGSESSQWLVKVLRQGSQITAASFHADAFRVGRDGTGAVPSLSFVNGTGYGMWYDAANARTSISAGGTAAIGIAVGSTTFLPAAYSLYFASTFAAGLEHAGSGFASGDLNFYLPTGNVYVGRNAALAVGASNGQFGLPTMAGKATATITIPTGHVLVSYDITNHKFTVNEGGGTIVQSAALA